MKASIEPLRQVKDPGDWRPSPHQRLLLEACLGKGATAVRAWSEWCEAVDIEHSEVDGGSFRLLPLAYRNLVRQSCEHPLMPRLKGLFRKSWFENQIQLRAASAAVGRLDDAGIPSLMLKGIALALSCYEDPGERPMEDFDLLVPARHARAALDVLVGNGWKTEYSDGLQVTDAIIAVRHGQNFSGPGGEKLDLHWHVLQECVALDADEPFWEEAVPLVIGGRQTRMLSTEDQVLHVCAHGVEWNAVPPVRWVADVVTLLRSAGHGFLWDRLVTQSRRCRLAFRVGTALKLLKEQQWVEVPEEVLRELLRGNRFERWELHWRTRRGRWAPLLPGRLFRYWRYRNLPASRLAPGAPSGISAYFRAHYGIDSNRALAARWARIGWARVLGGLRVGKG